MIVHFIKLFLAGGFWVAAGLRVLLTSVKWADVHFQLPQIDLTFLDRTMTEVAAVVVGGLLVAIWSETRRVVR